MLAQVTMLRYWKSEHNAETCEDAVGENTAQGLFAVADGAGTTLFADAWAEFLVQHFLRVPLLSNDPFEVEWWVRIAQEQFKLAFPTPVALSWNAQQKVLHQGSYSTLATLRISANEPTGAQAELLVFGDSCIFLHRPGSEQILSFPLQQAEEFERAPICVPSRAGLFNRYFHQSKIARLAMLPADVVVFATDAVAKWIVSAGNGRYPDANMALQEVVQQTESSWPAFIRACRANQEMIDDDSTALLIMLAADGTSAGSPLGSTTRHSQAVREQRHQDFLLACEEDNKERMAIYLGDGQDLLAEEAGISPEEISLARQVADALREVLAFLRQEIDNPNVTALMTSVWQRHAQLLYAEPCAANLRKTLARLGVPLEPVEPAVPVDSSLINIASSQTEQAASAEEPETADMPAQQNQAVDVSMLDTQILDRGEIQRLLQSREQRKET
jgi:hypothetical protein